MVSAATLLVLTAVAAPRPALVQIEDDPQLPRVLLIGDSISIGYTLPTRELLDGVANVHRPPTNCGPTTRGLSQIDDWLGDGQWDVIHWNFGLHDLKFVDEAGQLVDPADGNYQVPIEAYRENLDVLAAKLKATGATIIWRNTTPVPDGSKGRLAGDAAKYNAVAADVMAKHGIATHDLYAFAKEREAEIQLPENVHYSPDGSRQLAQSVAAVIRDAITKRSPSK